jgi:hypothetical protein
MSSGCVHEGCQLLECVLEGCVHGCARDARFYAASIRLTCSMPSVWADGGVEGDPGFSFSLTPGDRSHPSSLSYRVASAGLPYACINSFCGRWWSLLGGGGQRWKFFVQYKFMMVLLATQTQQVTVDTLT